MKKIIMILTIVTLLFLAMIMNLSASEINNDRITNAVIPGDKADAKDKEQIPAEVSGIINAIDRAKNELKFIDNKLGKEVTISVNGLTALKLRVHDRVRIQLMPNEWKAAIVYYMDKSNVRRFLKQSAP